MVLVARCLQPNSGRFRIPVKRAMGGAEGAITAGAGTTSRRKSCAGDAALRVVVVRASAVSFVKETDCSSVSFRQRWGCQDRS